MEKYFLMLACQSGVDDYTRSKCQEVIKQTVRNFQIYQTLKEREQEFRGFAEEKLTRPGFWGLTTAISSVSTQKLYLTGHNFMGIDSINLKIGRESEISATWSF